VWKGKTVIAVMKNQVHNLGVMITQLKDMANLDCRYFLQGGSAEKTGTLFIGK